MCGEGAESRLVEEAEIDQKQPQCRTRLLLKPYFFFVNFFFFHKINGRRPNNRVKFQVVLRVLWRYKNPWWEKRFVERKSELNFFILCHLSLNFYQWYYKIKVIKNEFFVRTGYPNETLNAMKIMTQTARSAESTKNNLNYYPESYTREKKTFKEYTHIFILNLFSFKKLAVRAIVNIWISSQSNNSEQLIFVVLVLESRRFENNLFVQFINQFLIKLIKKLTQSILKLNKF